MNHSPSCIPCFLRRVLRMANLVTQDEWLHRKILGEVMADLDRHDDKSSPPEVMHGVFRRTSRTLGNPDPYLEEKKRWKEEVLANVESIREKLRNAPDPLVQALKLSIAANEIDDELREGFSLKGLLDEIDSARLAGESSPDDFREAVRRSRSILFIHDTVGELFFDRLLIEQMARIAGPGCKLTSVVRTQHVLGDATREDAVELGLDGIAEIVDPGLECLGLPISECSAEFREVFNSTELVVAKGQACYQTLEGDGRAPDGEEKEIWFLFRVKCPVMAKQLAAGIGDLLLERN